MYCRSRRQLRRDFGVSGRWALEWAIYNYVVFGFTFSLVYMTVCRYRIVVLVGVIADTQGTGLLLRVERPYTLTSHQPTSDRTYLVGVPLLNTLG